LKCFTKVYGKRYIFASERRSVLISVHSSGHLLYENARAIEGNESDLVRFISRYYEVSV
jgi:hypothetical protein